MVTDDLETLMNAERRNFPARALISHRAIAQNMAVLRQAAPGVKHMVIVKANAYGHGLVPVGHTALRCGADYLGAAQVAEALSLRLGLDEAGVPREQAKIFTWIGYEDTDWCAPLLADLELSASSVARLAAICAAVRDLRDCGHQVTARVHLKIDTGMSRAGARLENLPAVAAAARMAQDEGLIHVVGAWSHLHSADDLSEAGRAATLAQKRTFDEGLEILAAAGITPEIRHLAATAGTLWHEECHYDMVRPGIAVYGLSPNPETASEKDLGLTPAMTLHAPLTMVKAIDAGEGVSYGHTWVAPEPSWIGMVPVGYADGIIRLVSNKGQVHVPGLKGTADGRAPMVGRVCMDQFLIRLAPAGPEFPEPDSLGVRVGDRVVLFGSGEHGEATASEWAQWAQTINYEITCRVGERIPREHVLPPEWQSLDTSAG